MFFSCWLLSSAFAILLLFNFCASLLLGCSALTLCFRTISIAITITMTMTITIMYLRMPFKLRATGSPKHFQQAY